MSLFSRIIQPTEVLATRRAYSSFFSSKPGGGRYFNSSKPPKSVVGSGKSQVDSGNANLKEHHANSKIGTSEESSRASSSMTNAQANTPGASQTPPSTSIPLLSTAASYLNGFLYPRHPVISAQDYKVHQFFSLHRPLLLHSLPTSAIFESPSRPFDIFALPPLASEGAAQLENRSFGTFDDPPEASMEADADAARQLARALVMHRVGSAISWDATLERLGMEGSTNEAGKAELAKEWARDWDILADSVKRKRKKKMKKHKLKKRRRAQRNQKMKLH